MESNNRPVHLKGVPASSGVGIGEAWILSDKKILVRPEKIDESLVSENLSKFSQAVNLLVKEYTGLKEIAEDDAAEIIEAQIQTLKDPELHKLVSNKIEQKCYDVTYAIFSTFNEYIQIMEASGIKWAEERTIDLVTIRDQLVELAKDKRRKINVEKGSVVFASNISPTFMIELSRTQIAGIVMQKGGLTSHAVILSQSLGIPCVVGLKWNHRKIKNKAKVALDGKTGEVIIYPNEEELTEFKKRQLEHSKRSEKDLEIARKPHITKCGSEFTLRANVEFLEELPRIKTLGAKGVGLLRTETILFQKTEFDVNSQVEFYSKVLEASGTDPITIRLLDAGGDKLLDDVEEESNPFLGWRGVRLLLDKEELLMNQLEAVSKTAAKFTGRVKVLVPMVSTIQEISLVKSRLDAVNEKLKNEGVEIDKALEFGIMVEVPSMALQAEQAAKHVDFFSIGTNDLTQYTLAVDRGNERISKLYDPLHPAVWKLIYMTKKGADLSGVPVTVCGEMASNPGAAACLVGMGINDLSMTTNAIPAVKSLLCSRNLSDMKKMSESILNAEFPEQIQEILKTFCEG